MLLFDNVMSSFKRLSKKFGVTKTVTATNCLVGKDLTLLADLPEFFPTKNLPADYHYIGPLIGGGGMPAPAWWPPPKNGRPLIYITMGTTGIGDFFHKVFELSKSADLAVVMTTGGAAKDLASVPGKFYVEDFIDGNLVMQSADLIVCHGGNGSIIQALLNGKPVIGIPNTPDAAFNMRRVEALGVGKLITWKEFASDASVLLKRISQLLGDPSAYSKAKALGERIKQYDAIKSAADLIEKGITT